MNIRCTLSCCIQSSGEGLNLTYLHSISFLSILLCLPGCQAVSVAQETAVTNENAPAIQQKIQYPDGQREIRHAGNEFSRQRIKEYLLSNNFKLDKPRGGDVLNDCLAIQPLLETMNFTFIEPDVITDDWNDPVLNVYKEKYESFNNAMGATEGTKFNHIPSWNINVYNLDTDGDGDIESILYGERLKVLDDFSLAHESSSYQIFELNAEYKRGAYQDGDPASPKLRNDDHLYSAIVKIDNNYAVLILVDWNVLIPQKLLRIYLVSKQNKHIRGQHFGSHQCIYKFE